MVFAPHLGEADEIALTFSEAVNFFGYGFALGGKSVKQCQVGDAQAAVVGGVFAQCELSVELLLRSIAVGGSSFKAGVLLRLAVGSLDKGLAVFGGLPLA